MIQTEDKHYHYEKKYFSNIKRKSGGLKEIKQTWLPESIKTILATQNELRIKAFYDTKSKNKRSKREKKKKKEPNALRVLHSINQVCFLFFVFKTQQNDVCIFGKNVFSRHQTKKQLFYYMRFPVKMSFVQIKDEISSSKNNCSFVAWTRNLYRNFHIVSFFL